MTVKARVALSLPSRIVGAGNVEVELANGIYTITGTGGVVADGDYGDIIVSGDGEDWTVDTSLISTYGRTLTAAEEAGDARAVLDLGDLAVLDTVATAKIDNDAVTYAKIQNISAASRLLGRGSAAGAGDTEEISLGNNLAMSGTTVNGTSIRTITAVFDGGGAALSTGIKGDLEVPYACTIQRVTMLADQSGSVVVDIWKDTYANYPPTDADSITAAAPPTISAATKSQDATLTGWTTAVTAGDILRFNIDSAATITRLTLSLKVLATV